MEEKYKILIVDNDESIINTLKIYLHNYLITGVTNSQQAIDMVRNEHFDLMILDYSAQPVSAEDVVSDIRNFNKELYILLVASKTEIDPPLEMIRTLDIQGYCEKSQKFDQLLLLVESALKSVEQVNTIKQINSELSESNQLLENSYLDTIEILRKTVEAKDEYTRGHSDRVAEYSLLIGEKLHLSRDEMNTLRIGALFHDIGKIGIPDSILAKDDQLTDEEYNEIKKHPTIGANILSSSAIFTNILPIVEHHHERYDGKGYPSGLSGTSIPFMARIVAVADTFDAMCSKRSYRNSLSFSQAVSEIDKCKGTQFDPEIANVFLDILSHDKNKILEIQSKYKEKN